MVLFRAAHTDVQVVDASTIAIDGATTLESEWSAQTAISVSARMKNVTISFPEGDVEIINLLGETSSFQNAELDEKPFGMCELSGTFIVKENELLVHNSKHLFFGAATAIAGTHSRYQPGKTDGTGDFARPKSGWLVKLDDGTDELIIALDNGVLTTGEWKLDGADGNWEVDVTVKCLPKDTYMEFKD